MLSDMVMPRMSGRELGLEIERAYPHLKVIYMSGYAEHAVIDQDTFQPGQYFLNKPFTAADLIRKVQQVLTG